MFERASDLYLNGCKKLLFPGANKAVESPAVDYEREEEREGGREGGR